MADVIAEPCIGVIDNRVCRLWVSGCLSTLKTKNRRSSTPQLYIQQTSVSAVGVCSGLSGERHLREDDLHKKKEERRGEAAPPDEKRSSAGKETEKPRRKSRPHLKWNTSRRAIGIGLLVTTVSTEQNE